MILRVIEREVEILRVFFESQKSGSLLFSGPWSPLAAHENIIGFGKRGLLEKGSFQKSPFSRDSREFRDSRDSREPPDCGKYKGESDHFLELLENLEILEILEIPPVKRPLSSQ